MPQPKPTASQPDANKNKAAFTRLNQNMSAEIAAKIIAVKQKGSELIVRLPEKVSFPLGGDVLSKRITPILLRVGNILKSSEGAIMITGHADTSPLTRNDSADNRAKKRRVEIRVLRTESAN